MKNRCVHKKHKYYSILNQIKNKPGKISKFVDIFILNIFYLIKTLHNVLI